MGGLWKSIYMDEGSISHPHPHKISPPFSNKKIKKEYDEKNINDIVVPSSLHAI